MNTLSQYLVQPRRVHLIDAKHLMRYLKGTIDFDLYYDGNHDYRLYGYIDADWARSVSEKRWTEEAHQVDVIVWDLLRVDGLAGNSPVFLLARLK